jgi:hypothetical protein
MADQSNGASTVRVHAWQTPARSFETGRDGDISVDVAGPKFWLRLAAAPSEVGRRHQIKQRKTSATTCRLDDFEREKKCYAREKYAC